MKAHLELSLAKCVKDDRKSFFKCINNKEKMKSSGNPLINGEGTLVTEDTEKTGLLNAFFALVFTGNQLSGISDSCDQGKEKLQGKLPLGEELF